MIDLRPAGRALNAVVAGITDSDLSAATPCDEYSVAELLVHVDEAARGFGGVDGEPLTPGADRWRETLKHRVEQVGTAWAAPQAWEGSSELAGLGLSNAEWGRIALTELVVHGWDLARATGQELVLPEETVRACYEHVATFLDEPPVPELWGTPVKVDERAALLDRLVGITGRSPRVGGGE
ncbi:TIGR03086 family metal-binding protein [Kribbella sp. NPDC051770]|uniref:TIGR03086 family metal-binding protein n=1 Tax=Kribbella sp. NPDC051770 TaxID=3155413 RepID=UPI00341BBD79